MLLRGPRRRSHQSRTSGNDSWNRYVFSRWRNRVGEGDDWISDGRVFHRVDAATGNDRRPMDSSGMQECLAGVTLMNVGCECDDQAGLQHEPADPCMAEPDHAALGTPWPQYIGLGLNRQEATKLAVETRFAEMCPRFQTSFIAAPLSFRTMTTKCQALRCFLQH